MFVKICQSVSGCGSEWERERERERRMHSTEQQDNVFDGVDGQVEKRCWFARLPQALGTHHHPHHHRRPVWPDVGVKSCPNVTKSHSRSSQISFYIRVRFFKIAQRVAIILATFARDFVTKNFQKSPNLVTLSSTDWLMMHTNTLTYDSAGASRKTSKRQNVANVFATATSSIPLHSNSIKS